MKRKNEGWYFYPLGVDWIMKSGCIYCNAVRWFEGRFFNVRQKEKLCQRESKLLNFDLKKEDNGVHNKTRSVYVNRRFLHHYTFAQTSISQWLQTDLLCTPSAIVLFHCCVNHTLFQGSLWHALDCCHLHNSEKWSFMWQGIQSCLCKEMLVENCTPQNEAWCRLSAGEHRTTTCRQTRLWRNTEALCITVKSEGILNVSCQSLIFILFFFLQCFLK